MAAKNSTKKAPAEEATPELHKREEFENQQTLLCDLTDAEILNAARMAGDQKIAFDGSVARDKEEAAANKEHTKSLQNRFDLTMEKLQTGKELRSIDVIVTHDYEAGVYFEVRQDTKEEIARRPLRDSERQQEIPSGEPEGASGDTEEATSTASDGENPED